MKRMHSLQDVKKKLNVSSFENLPEEKVKELVALLPNMDKETALDIINPNYFQIVGVLSEQFQEAEATAITSNDTSQNAVYAAYNKIIDHLLAKADCDKLTPQESETFYRLAIDVADKMNSKDSENKKFLSWLNKNKADILGGVILLGFALLDIYGVGSNSSHTDI